ncbi:MAG: AI-2E family transporter [Velocimicrobium sp.]
MKIESTETSTRAGLRKYLFQGIVAFLVIAASVIFFFLLFRLNTIHHFFMRILNILQPIIWGLVIAYILNPVVNFFDHTILRLVYSSIKNEEKAKRIIRFVSILIAFIIALFFVYILGSLIIPQVYITILGIVTELPNNITQLSNWVESLTISNQMVSNYIDQMINKISLYFQQWAQGDLLPQLNIWATYFATGVLSILTVFKNLVIGLIVSVYVLSSKEKFCAQGKMLVYAICKHSVANEIIDVVRQSNRIFSGFIVGKVIDSTIIGVLCFIGLSILNMPYTLLISVIIGVTNIVPFFGPYIGAIPSALLILVASPIHALYFIIFILVIQQIDGNIIGPKILGDSTGLSAFWVIFSILLGGGLFGLVGMLVGVPTFAVFYYIVRRFISYLLNKKELKQTSEEYEEIESIQWLDGEVVYIPIQTYSFEEQDKKEKKGKKDVPNKDETSNQDKQ